MIRSSNADNSCLLRAIILLIFSRFATATACSFKSGTFISISDTIDLDISLKVAPRPIKFRYFVLPFKNQYKYLLLILSEQIRFLNPWLQYISQPAIATFPIGALDERITVPSGNGDSPVFLTANSVILRTLSVIMYVSSFNSAGVIHLISPSQYSSTPVLGVLPDTISQISPSLYFAIYIIPTIHSFCYAHLDFRTFVCYNIFGATLHGRRLAFSARVIACVYIEIHLWKSNEEVCAYAYNGAFYSHHQLMHYLLCSWLCRWF